MSTNDVIAPIPARLTLLRRHKLIAVCAALLVLSIVLLIALGFIYGGQPDYWLVGLPGFGTAIGTVGLAGATVRLIQREGRDREMTLRALAHSQLMADEAARHRRDDRARLLRIRLSGRAQAFPRRPGHHRTPLLDGKTFDMPADGANILVLSQALSICAEDGAPIDIAPNGLYINDLLTIGMQTVEFPRKVNPTSREDRVWFEIEHTVAQWVAIAEQRERGNPGEEATAFIGVDDGFDDGVIDSYTISQGGCPLRRSPNRPGQWVLDLSTESNGQPPVVCKVLPMKRQYFVSKAANEPLATPR